MGCLRRRLAVASAPAAPALSGLSLNLRLAHRLKRLARANGQRSIWFAQQPPLPHGQGEDDHAERATEGREHRPPTDEVCEDAYWEAAKAHDAPGEEHQAGDAAEVLLRRSFERDGVVQGLEGAARGADKDHDYDRGREV